MAEYQLVMRVGPSPGKTYPLTLNEIIIGRDISCDIVINDAEISRNHCKLVLQGDSYWVEDLGSTNGTHVNDRRVSGQHPSGGQIAISHRKPEVPRLYRPEDRLSK